MERRSTSAESGNSSVLRLRYGQYQTALRSASGALGERSTILLPETAHNHGFGRGVEKKAACSSYPLYDLIAYLYGFALNQSGFVSRKSSDGFCSASRCRGVVGGLSPTQG